MKDDQSPAFPRLERAGADAHDGMTLRDYFAAKALPLAYKFWMEDYYHPDSEDADLRSGIPRTGFSTNYGLIADDAYEMADAMLRARSA